MKTDVGYKTTQPSILLDKIYLNKRVQTINKMKATSYMIIDLYQQKNNNNLKICILD